METNIKDTGDLLDGLMSDNRTSKFKSTDSNYDRGKRKDSLWDKEDIKAVKIDHTKFKKPSSDYKSFAISYHFVKDDVSQVTKDKVRDKFVATAKQLVKAGYKYRTSYGVQDVINNAILDAIPGSSVEVYRPWKKFNVGTSENCLVVLNAPTEASYSIGAGVHFKYKELTPVVRAVLGAQTHVMLGDTTLNPVDMLIVYTSCGTTTLQHRAPGTKINFKTVGFTSFPLNLCDAANIPVYSFMSKDFAERIKDKVNTQVVDENF